VALPPKESLTQADLSELMEDIVEAEEEPPLDSQDAAAGTAGGGEPRPKSGKGSKPGKIGKLLYGSEGRSWNYVPTC
jgi:hypothetical protein